MGRARAREGWARRGEGWARREDRRFDHVARTAFRPYHVYAVQPRWPCPAVPLQILDIRKMFKMENWMGVNSPSSQEGINLEPSGGRRMTLSGGWALPTRWPPKPILSHRCHGNTHAPKVRRMCFWIADNRSSPPRSSAIARAVASKRCAALVRPSKFPVRRRSLPSGVGVQPSHNPHYFGFDPWHHLAYRADKNRSKPRVRHTFFEFLSVMPWFRFRRGGAKVL